MHMRTDVAVFTKVVVRFDSELTSSIDASPFSRANFHRVVSQELESLCRNIGFPNCPTGFSYVLDVFRELVLAEQKLV